MVEQIINHCTSATPGPGAAWACHAWAWRLGLTPGHGPGASAWRCPDLLHLGLAPVCLAQEGVQGLLSSPAVSLFA